jgi:hypothetical protein
MCGLLQVCSGVASAGHGFLTGVLPKDMYLADVSDRRTWMCCCVNVSRSNGIVIYTHLWECLIHVMVWGQTVWLLHSIPDTLGVLVCQTR